MRGLTMRSVLVGGMALAMSGCDLVLLNPAGDIAKQQSDLLIVSTWLMLLIIVPVILMTFWFAWKYRASNTTAPYEPDWDHSTQLELYIWSAPLLIIIALGAMTWITTHTLDPRRPIDRIAKDQVLSDSETTLRIQAVALDWKWLFIYPDYGIAVVNEVAAPINTPIRFETTSPTVMNALFVPTLAGMVYAMPGMDTHINAVINKVGDYEGISGNYSGAGYSDMRFTFKGLSQQEFTAWIANAMKSPNTLTRAQYQKLERPSIKEPVKRFAQVDPGLYSAILNLCVNPNKMCLHDMLAIDKRGGLGKAGIMNVSRLAYEPPQALPSIFRRRSEYVTALCTDDLVAAQQALNGSFISTTSQPAMTGIIR